VENLTLELPALYADHHVLEVRRILQEMPGISEVYASIALQDCVIFAGQGKHRLTSWLKDAKAYPVFC
jgi:hypothetical protein